MKRATVDQTEWRSNQSSVLEVKKTEGREWWLWGLAVTVTLVLTLGIVSLTFPPLPLLGTADLFVLREWVRGLAALVILFDLYAVYQHSQLHRVRERLAEREELYRLISENAADMIALIDRDGRRVYNSPAYQKVLGYSLEELSQTSALSQVHPDDRDRFSQAVSKAIATGIDETIEYRMRHKEGSWRILESTASPIQQNGKVTRLVIVNRDITARKKVEEKLAHTTLHDSLTNLPNRALFLDRLQRVIAVSRCQPHYKFAVLFIDIDDFKIFNESLGNLIGDQLLIQIARRLACSVRSLDTVSHTFEFDSSSLINGFTFARLAGDEFTVLLDNIRNSADAIRVAERLQQKLAEPFVVEGHELFISAGIGITVSGRSRTAAEDMLRDAEIAMQRAKRAGKARCEVFDSAMHVAAVARLRLETDLRRAFERNEFVAYYQPIVCLARRRIVGVEVLTRWQRNGTVVSPADFIAVADEIGLIVPMNMALLRDSCQQLRAWQAQFPSTPNLWLSSNIAPKQFVQPGLAGEFSRVIVASGLDPRDLHFEIVETIAMGEPEQSARVLTELRAAGVSLSIDDFGTGYSSLSRLQQLPIDTLKIDRRFISNLEQNAEKYEIVRAIITLAHNLGMKVVAEGTETAAQVEMLGQLGCDLAQGYYFSPPESASVIAGLIEMYNREMPSQVTKAEQ
ncbi:MAG TPA: EAL domain-containing protein [Terriglobales bacterium]|nr:EAL domain-containing protein [Terriglobales bacterium]